MGICADVLFMHAGSRDRRFESCRAERAQPSDLAGEAYAVALFGLPEIANLAKAYYHATIDLERHIEGQQDLSALGCIPVWRSAFQRLEDTTAALQNGDLAEK
ncbi:hypothetical protein GY14_32290 [Delftia tsuruhatensis]|nr:hypothetical protein GY14_32290 [Delftia tsuruhatensis]